MRPSTLLCLPICILPLPAATQEVTVLPGYDEAIFALTILTRPYRITRFA